MFNLPEPLATWFLVIKIIFIFVSLVLAFGFLYALYHAWDFHPKFELKRERAKKKMLTLRTAMLRERWESIVKKFSLGTPESARLAVIEADALVDTALKAMEIPGEHLADRLSSLDSEELKSIDNLWKAHRMRNDLVHTPGFIISSAGAKMALDHYEAFLKEIEIL